MMFRDIDSGPAADTDVLAAATRALRDVGETSPAEAAATRRRVLSAVRPRAAARVAVLRVVLPAAAVIVSSVALAAPGGIPGVWRAIERRFSDSPPAAPPASGQSSATPVWTREPVSGRARESTPIAPTSTAIAPMSPTTVVAAPRPGASAPPKLSKDEDLALYRQAHSLHFGAQDALRAILAWDDYLRRSPGGRFATEAHYNRAMCLVRLGRTDEARRALALFANGAFGGYRKSEAAALLAAMGR